MIEHILLAIGALNLLGVVACFFLLRSLRRNASASERGLSAQEDLQVRIQMLGQGMTTELRSQRMENAQGAQTLRDEMRARQEQQMHLITGQLREQSNLQHKQMEAMQEQQRQMMLRNQAQQEHIRLTLAQEMQAMREENEKKLEQMRHTVDEKLNETLEKRLDHSFRQVGDQLERVYKSMGEMQKLAAGVDGLQRVLTNVKIRGTWAEIQLENILDQILAKGQYEKNVAVRPHTQERVEFAVRLPGKAEGEELWLPIDAKFPHENYLRILNAAEENDGVALDEACRRLEANILVEARKIHSKYICPPHTTDFAILYLPTEGLYAEILRRDGVCERLQREYHVMIAGPTTLSAVLNSLSVGFRTLAIERRSSEVWQLLGAVKGQYATFTSLLNKAQGKLDEASRSLGSAADRARLIDKRLGNIESLDDETSRQWLNL